MKWTILMVLLAGCGRPADLTQFSGKTMGSTYNVRVANAPVPEELAKAVDDLLVEINQSMSTYIKTSIISQINASTDTEKWYPVDHHFDVVYRRSRDIYRDTGGAFNPAVGPLVNAWGFGPEDPGTFPDEAAIRALMEVSKFEAFEWRDTPPGIRKHLPGAKLDFSGIAKGYGVDAVGELLERHGIDNYVVEIGGEVRARGRRPEGGAWRVGVESPSDSAVAGRDIRAVVPLDNAGIATSGTYRNYEVSEGKKLSHILDPKTGRPAENSLLSVSVLAADTMTADGYATALMVMGVNDGFRFVEARKNLQAYFIAIGDEGRFIEKRTAGFPDARE